MSGRGEHTGTSPGNAGRFDGYDVTAQRKYWDGTTAEVVLGRLAPPAELKFFTEEGAETAGALCDVILAQHTEPKVPVLSMVDARLHEGPTDGWRYEDLPEDSEAWRTSLSFLDQDAKDAYGHRFHECTIDQQRDLVQAVQDAESWHGWPAKHVWSLWGRYICAAFYAHPWA